MPEGPQPTLPSVAGRPAIAALGSWLSLTSLLPALRLPPRAPSFPLRPRSAGCRPQGYVPSGIRSVPHGPRKDSGDGS